MQALPALSLVGMGLQMMGGMADAEGKAAGYRHQAGQAQRRELSARTAADETDAVLRQELISTIGNIRTIRAAANVASDSPTGLALENAERRESNRQRTIRVGNLTAQANQSRDDATFLRSAGSAALGTGYLTAFGRGIAGLSTLRF